MPQTDCIQQHDDNIPDAVVEELAEVQRLAWPHMQTCCLEKLTQEHFPELDYDTKLSWAITVTARNAALWKSEVSCYALQY